MEIGSRQWERLLIDGAKKLGIEIDVHITAQFSIHASELIQWNRKINLTAITNPRDIAIKHFLDSLTPARFIPDQARLLDIGSGGGFPGIPLKILKPSLSVLLIDGVRKKVNFLKQVLRILRIGNIEARQIRAESLLTDPAYRNSFDVIVSRALSSLQLFVKMALPLLAKHGILIAMKGEMPVRELNLIQSDFAGDRYSFEVEKYQLPSVDASRSIIIIRESLG